jgi:hypothetical protein
MSFPLIVRRALGFVAILCAAGSASAQVARVFVSVNGNDGNVCSNVATPCRTFSGGITQVDDGGEVIVLDTGSYGGTTITKGVTLDVPPGVVAFAAQPFTINAPGKAVTFRGLTLKSLTPGSGTGISVTAVTRLTVESCVIADWLQGISISAGATVVIRDSVFRSGSTAVIASVPSGANEVTAEHCRFEGFSDTAFFMLDNTRGWIRDSVITDCVFGVDAFGSSGKPAEANVENCMIVGGANSGILAEGAFSTIRVSNTTVSKCTTGMGVSAGSLLESYGNNQVRGNTTETSGTITTVPRI